jgi:hypothetical protein
VGLNHNARSSMITYLMTGAGLCRINLRSKDLVPIAVRDSHGIAVGHAHVRVTRFKAAQRWSIPAVCAVIAAVVLLLAATIALTSVHLPLTLIVAASTGAWPSAISKAKPANERFHCRYKPRRTYRRKVLSCRYCSVKHGSSSGSCCKHGCFRIASPVVLSSFCQADSMARANVRAGSTIMVRPPG